MIHDYGWSDDLQQQFDAYRLADLSPGRVILQHRGVWVLATEYGEVRAEISGRLAGDSSPGGYPVAGDWVAASTTTGGAAIIHHVLPRRTAFTRRAAGSAGGEQVVAANIDFAFLTMSLGEGFNPRRLERYLASAWQSGAKPVVLLTKADLCDDVDDATAETCSVAAGAPVHALAALTGQGLDALEPYLLPGCTSALLGSSGEGKSTLVNALLGSERMATQAIRESDGRGRHTTSHRELVLLPQGGLLLDTPGMRELGLWESENGLSLVFDDIEALAIQCRFRDCGHTNEPGCAVRARLENGQLDRARWSGFQKLKRELAHQESKHDPALRAARRRHWVRIAKANRKRERGFGRD